jgi:iron(II)-dependent oxidoreductase
MGSGIADRTEAAAVVDALTEARERTLALVDAVSDEDLGRVHSTLMSPLVWDLGHIAAFEDLWLNHRHGGIPLLHDELADVYDAFETPRANRGDLPLLGPAEARDYLAKVRERTLETISTHGASEVHELVIRHEQQHCETMLQTIQLGRVPGGGAAFPPRGSASQNGDNPHTGLRVVRIPAGAVEIGARAQGFAYDNERPRHRTDVRSYLIGQTPITNASYLTFVEGGGYERREWWSDEGWAWKEEYDITRPGQWTADLSAEWRLGRREAIDPHAPVVHVSWFEADAFARAHDARLPTEIEWEKAATWDQERETARAFPWGNHPPLPGVHANVDHVASSPAPAASLARAGTSPYGVEQMIGDVWEWTASDFTGYPGFRAHPYKEYSEVFFGTEYKVLRGGSWATRSRVITPTFRNWDYPQRRQIFSGFRIARND